MRESQSTLCAAGSNICRFGPVLLLALVLIAGICLLPGDVSAQTPSDLDTMRILNVAGVSPGDTFNVDLYMRNIDTITAFTFRVTYDANFVEPLVVVDNDGDSSVVNDFFRVPVPPPGNVKVQNVGLPSPGVITGAYADFDLLPQNIFLPGRGLTVRMQWRVKPTASFGTTFLRFEDDPFVPSSFNVISNYSEYGILSPVLVDGAVVITEDTDTTTPGTNHAPTIPPPASPLSVKQGDLITFDVTATDPDGDSLILRAINLPTGATFTPANPVGGRIAVSGTFRWIPTFGQSGGFTVGFEAVDSAGAISTIRNVTINVTEVPTDLLFTTSAPNQDPRGGVPGLTGVIVPINLTSTQESYGVQYDFVYDPLVFQITLLQPTNRLTGFSIYDNLGETPGRLRVVTFSLTGDPIGAGSTNTLFNIIGNILPGAVPGVYDLTFENAWESVNPDPNVASVPLTTQDGFIFVDNLGDANLDTRIDVGDVVAIVGYILNDFNFTARQFGAGDVTANDTLDVFDLVAVLNTIFGSTPVQSTPASNPGTVNFVYNADDGPYGSYVLTADMPVQAAGAQFEIIYDPNQTALATPEVLADAAGLNFSFRDHGSGRMKALLFNLSDRNSNIRSGGAEILRIPVTSASNGIPLVELRDVRLSDPGAGKIEVAGFGGLPRAFTLEQNYPNPFNAGTSLPFTIRSAGSTGTVDTRLEVFNVLGQRIATLIDGPLGEGQHVVAWDGRDRGGRTVASGLYFYRLTSGGQSETRKMVLLK